MKKIILIGLFLISGLVNASEIIISSRGSIFVATEKTELPYNILLVNDEGALCYRGSASRVEGIIEKMINNHQTNDRTITSFEVSNKEITFSLSNDDEYYNGSSRPVLRTIQKCILK